MKIQALAVLVAAIAVTATASPAFAVYHPTLGRFMQRDAVGYADGNNLYQYTRSNPIVSRDPSGLVTFEQVNDIAAQLGIAGIKNDHSNATATIKKVQRALGVQDDGDFGPGTVGAYERWAQAKGVQPVQLRDSKTAKQVLDWIVQYWPNEHKCAKDCPVYYGEFLALIHFESRDRSTRTGGKPYTYFNAVGGPYASQAGGKLIGTTAVGLAQFTRATAPRETAYDGEKSIDKALELMFNDAANFNCNFEPRRNKEILQRGLNRWEAWRTFNQQINTMGGKINKLIQEKHDGDPSKVTNSELNTILGIE